MNAISKEKAMAALRTSQDPIPNEACCMDTETLYELAKAFGISDEDIIASCKGTRM